MVSSPMMRLRGVVQHLTAASSVAVQVPTERQHSPTDAMPPRLLTDEQVKDFVRTGYVKLSINELSAEFHASVHEKATLLNGPHGRACLHNNIYPAIPELGTVMRSPTVRGALQSVLGTDYAMHACRAFHNSDGRDSDQNFHKDGLEGHGPVRHHRPRWAMIMYVPLGSSLQMGPTAILPGSQYLSSTSEDWTAVNTSHPPNSNEDYVQRGQSVNLDENKALSPELEDTDICFPPGQGSAYLIHFDMLHKGTARLIEDLGHPTRQMFKFQYFRVSSPSSPSWNHSGAVDPTGGAFANTGAPDRLLQIWQATWDWMKGLPTAPTPMCHKSDPVVLSERTKMLYAMGPSSEGRRVGAAYGLGRAAMAGCTESLAALLEAVQVEDNVAEHKPSLALPGTDVQRAAMHGLSTSGDAGAAAMLPYLLNSETSPVVLAAIATAIGEAVLNPTGILARAYGTAMSRLRFEILEHEIDDTVRFAPTTAIKLERHRGTAFCSVGWKEQYMKPRWQALAAAAVGLWHLVQRAVSIGNADICAVAVEVVMPFTETAVELGPQCRQNATGALLTLSSVSNDLAMATRERLMSALARLAEDDDRYVRAAALQALARVRITSSLAAPTALQPRTTAIDEVFSTLVDQRWCTISGLAGFSEGASF